MGVNISVWGTPRKFSNLEKFKALVDPDWFFPKGVMLKVIVAHSSLTLIVSHDL